MISLTDAARTQHKQLALFAILQCWIRGLDGIVFQKAELLRILGLDRIKKARAKSLRDDLAEFFKSQMTVWVADKVDDSGNLNSFAGHWVYRHEIDQSIWDGKLSDEDRFARVRAAGLRIDSFKLWDRQQQPSIIGANFEAITEEENRLQAYLGMLADGRLDLKGLW